MNNCVTNMSVTVTIPWGEGRLSEQRLCLADAAVVSGLVGCLAWGAHRTEHAGVDWSNKGRGEGCMEGHRVLMNRSINTHQR